MAAAGHVRRGTIPAAYSASGAHQCCLTASPVPLGQPALPVPTVSIQAVREDVLDVAPYWLGAIRVL